MKKIITLTVVCIAMLANAAQIDWKLTVGKGYDGFSVYAISGTTAASVLAAFASDEIADWTAPVAGLTSVIIDGNTSRTAAEGTTVDISASDNLVFVIFDKAIAEGTQFWVLNDYTIPAANVYTPPASGTKAAISLATQGVAGTGTFTAVPEPASAMLALAGVAMLIRRRK
jgi:hypothetical protein